MTTADAYARWHPVATAVDLPRRHVFQGQLLGRELAIWRADDGFVNIWENRCLHRGVRLSVGTNDGSELTCRYHGWRYANRSAGCTYIPAHPANAPARTICNRVFPCVERYGLIWSGEAPIGDVMAPSVVGSDAVALRSLPVNAPVELVLEHLRRHRFAPSTDLGARDIEMAVVEADEFSVTLRSDGQADSTTATFFVQPVDANRSVIRGVLASPPEPGTELEVWRSHATGLAQLVGAIEIEAARRAPLPPLPIAIEAAPIAVDVEAADVPVALGVRASGGLRVHVTRKWATAEGVIAFELEPVDGTLPTFQPGAHIDVHLPNGLIRQYSITNGPGEGASYRIGVKREPDSRGGSVCLHDTVREGDLLMISPPRNNFPLRRDAVSTTLIAGGIGITPMLAMAQALAKMNLPFELHVFARSSAHLAFADVLEGLGSAVVAHLGLAPADTTETITEVVGSYAPHRHLYVCGPGPMLAATREIASGAGWPDESVHFEYFKNVHEVDDSSTFEISLARSGLTVPVPAGSTILEVLRAAGLEMASSCEQGACGTCAVTVIDGDIDHQDVHLNASERAAGETIITCVSRARGPRLILDL